MHQAPLGFAHLLSALDFYTASPPEIVIVGPSEADATEALKRAVRDRFRPNKVLVVAEERSDLEKEVPLLANRYMQKGSATAYVCRQGTCKQPVVSAEDLLAQLGS
jgi:uncharacterized protein YyaL (SSP411 family)